MARASSIRITDTVRVATVLEAILAPHRLRSINLQASNMATTNTARLRLSMVNRNTVSSNTASNTTPNLPTNTVVPLNMTSTRDIRPRRTDSNRVNTTSSILHRQRVVTQEGSINSMADINSIPHPLSSSMVTRLLLASSTRHPVNNISMDHRLLLVDTGDSNMGSPHSSSMATMEDRLHRAGKDGGCTLLFIGRPHISPSLSLMPRVFDRFLQPVQIQFGFPVDSDGG